ncbi:hypothetical protein AB0A63_17770 [Lentzea sp. NPDC042327]|uniref:hypothetical protein n=1 Tax=Lentzea sp. NPDC042327 TaxID=3154801 RepID=UPI0033EDF91F
MTAAAWLGDLVRAVAAETPPGREPDPALVRQIERLLGIEHGTPPVVEDAAPPPPEPQPLPPPEEHVRTRMPEAEETGRRFGDFEQPPSYRTEQDPMVGLKVSWDDEGEPDRPWLPVPDLPVLSPEQLLRRPPHEPLLRRASTSAVVQALFSRRMPDTEVDVPALVEQLASARAVSELPRLAHPTLRFGAHVLMDRSEGMSLFWRDQQALVGVVNSVIGASLTEVSVLSGSPRRMQRGHRHPAPDRAVLVLAGFGIRRGRAEQEVWEPYVRWLRRRRCRVVALVPFPRDRWPGWLTSLMPVVSWDRVTTVGAVRAALGRTS